MPRYVYHLKPNIARDADGYLDSRFGIPGLTCNACNDTWCGLRALPTTCPKAIQDWLV